MRNLNQIPDIKPFSSRYKYETSMSHNTQVNGSENLLPCLSNHSLTEKDETPDVAATKGSYYCL